jgi:uncharacterized phage protein gp47/JayE
MTTSVDELTTTKTAETLLGELLVVLRAEGLPTTAWQPGSVPRTLLKADATVLADLYATVRSVARGAFLGDAENEWLTLLAASRFDLTRTPADYTQGVVLVAVASGAGPYTVNAAGLVVTDGARRWRSTNAAPVTVSSAASVAFTVKAESPGEDYNAANGAITSVVTPALAGLSVSNPVYASGTWITRAGADAETDAALRARCRDRWGTLGRGAGDAAYRYWARTGHAYAAQVTRAEVHPGVGDGTLTIYVAGPSGVIADAGIIAAVQAWVNTNKARTDDVTVTAASARAVSVTGTVRVRAANDSAANRALATDALAAYFAGLGIGDDVDLGALYHAIYSATGVVDVDLDAPAADVSVNNDEVAVPTVALTWVTV